MPLLEARNLHKHYRDVRAVNGVNLAISEGICFGLLGPNGAGKTTTVEMLEGISSPSSGEVLFNGCPLGSRFREQAGIMFQHTSLPERLRVDETLKLFASFYNHTRSIDELIERFTLGSFVDRDTSRLSGGQLQRLLLAVAMINDPVVIFLDEPTTGLDPQARRNFWEAAHAIKAEGKTLVLTTHYMEEAQELCDEIGIMDQGQVIALGTPEELLRRHFDASILSLPGTILPEAPEGMTMFRRDGRSEIHCTDLNGALRRLMDADIPLDELQLRNPNLEDLFLELTGHELRA